MNYATQNTHSCSLVVYFIRISWKVLVCVYRAFDMTLLLEAIFEKSLTHLCATVENTQ